MIDSSTSPWPLKGSPPIAEHVENAMKLPSELIGAELDALTAKGAAFETTLEPFTAYDWGLHAAVAPKQVS